MFEMCEVITVDESEDPFGVFLSKPLRLLDNLCADLAERVS